MGCGALCAQLPRAAGWSPTRGRQTRGGGLGWDSSQYGGRVQFCAETALQPRARRPVLWFSVLFHGISRKQLPRDQRPHSPADATVTDTPHTHTTSPGPAAHTVFLEPCPPRAAGSSKEPGTEAGDRGWGWSPGWPSGWALRTARSQLRPGLKPWSTWWLFLMVVTHLALPPSPHPQLTLKPE